MSQRSNLKKLALFLSKKRASKKFDMQHYAKVNQNIVQPQDIKEYNECATVCCAVGHGPYAGIPVGKSKGWNEYMEKFIPSYDHSYDWLFSQDWKEFDNTPKGAAYRIGYYLKCGIPEWFDEYTIMDDHRDKYKEAIKIGKEYLMVEALKKDKAYLAKLAAEANIGLE